MDHQYFHAQGIALAVLSTTLMTVANAGKKRILESVSPLALAFVMYALASILTLSLLFVFGAPVVVWGRVLPALLLCLISGVACEVFFLLGIRKAEFSIALPLLAFSPLFSLLFGYLHHEEIPRPVAGVGVFLVVCGAYLLSVKLPLLENFLLPLKAILKNWEILACAATGAFLFSYQQVVVQDSSLLFFFACHLSGATIVFGIALLCSKGLRAFTGLSRPGFVTVVTCLWALALGLTFASQLYTYKSYSSAVQQLQSFISVVIGVLVFKEGAMKQRMAAAAVMSVGLVIIVMWGR